MFTEEVEMTRETIYNQGKDDYGRRTYGNYAVKGIIVTMPRRTAHVRPEGENYLVNLHDGFPKSTVVYFRTLNQAKDFLIANGERRVWEVNA